MATVDPWATFQDAPADDPWAAFQDAQTASPPLDKQPALRAHMPATTPAAPSTGDIALSTLNQTLMDTPVLGTALNATAGVWNTGVKALSGLAGMVPGLGGADTVRGVQDARSVQLPPSNDPVAKGLELVQRGAESIAAPVDRAVENLPDGARTIVRGIEEAILDIATVAGMEAARVARPATTVSGAAKAAVVADADPVATLRAAGYKFRPSDVQAIKPSEKVPGLRRESLQEPAALRKDLILENQANTTRLAAEELGVPGKKSLMEGDYRKLKEPHFAKYEEVNEALNRTAPPPDFLEKLDAAKAQAGFKPGDKPSTTQIISALRRQERNYARKGGPVEDQAARAAGDAADALEGAMGARLEALGEADLLKQYQASRQALAKIHDYETATKGGQVDPQMMRKLDRRNPGRLTGHAKIISDAADLSRNVVRSSQGATGVRSSVKSDSLLESLPLGIGAAVKGAKWLGDRALMAVPGVDVRKPPFQNKFGREATTESERQSLREYGKKQSRPDPVAPRPKQLGTGDVEFTPTGGVVPPEANRLAGDLDLVPDDVPNPQALPKAPPMLTADVPPVIRGDIDFTASPELNYGLAGDLGLAEPRRMGELEFTPTQLGALDAPTLSLLNDVVEQLGLRVDTPQPSLMTPVAEPVPYGPRVQLEAPPGRVGKPKKPKGKK